MSKTRIDVRSIPNENCKTGCNKKERKEWKKITHALERLTVYKPI